MLVYAVTFAVNNGFYMYGNKRVRCVPAINENKAEITLFNILHNKARKNGKILHLTDIEIFNVELVEGVSYDDPEGIEYFSQPAMWGKQYEGLQYEISRFLYKKLIA